MPFIPHTEDDIQSMLNTIGVKSIDELFAEIPQDLRQVDLSVIPTGISEMELSRVMQARAEQDSGHACFIGAGSYEHFIPGAVWEVATRGEFMTAYTPYQAEASQGSLQLVYEYQTMMASLMGLDASNASVYDGASGLAEAVLMAMRIKALKETPIVLLPKTVHPHYREVVKTIVGQHKVQLIDIDYESSTGRVNFSALQLYEKTAHILVLPQPNFFGILEEVDQLTDWARQHNILVIGLVNPMAMSLLKPPGQWGVAGVDIACGEGQSLGIPLSQGGPYYGFMCCKQEYIRQMPGRIVGRTVDQEGKMGFVLTLQAREQHIRRAKATSNICTNQGLMVTASTIYMSLMGPLGLRRMASLSHQHAALLFEQLIKIPGVEPVFASHFFHEFVVRLPKPIDEILKILAKKNLQAGYNLKISYPELGECLLICVTETKTPADIQNFIEQLREIL
jgi:glycine dehydrogenase subunit 1